VSDPSSGSQSIAVRVEQTISDHGDRVAVVSRGERITYAELGERAHRFAAGLVAAGIGVGDRVAIWAPNSAEWVVSVLGLFRAGAVLVPVNTRFKGAEAADILGRSHARALVTVTDFLDANPLDLLAGADLPDLATTIVLAGPVPEGALAYDAVLAAGSTDDRSEVGRRVAALTGDDPSDILFTSGTTGKPKGVVQTQARTLLVASDWTVMTGLAAGDRYLMVNPYFHMFGLKAGILASVLAGATMYPEPVFDVDRVLRTVAEEQITVLPGAPTIYQSILDHPERDSYDLSSLRIAVTGAADIPVSLIERIFAELPFELVVTGYGLTEGGTAAGTRLGDDPETIATTVGRPRPGFELRIVDGEVQVRGPMLLRCYRDGRDPKTPDGWLPTGDLGTFDDGVLDVHGRADDLIITGGENVWPEPIEAVLRGVPGVIDVAVAGTPDPEWGQAVTAHVVGDVTLDALRAAVKDVLPAFCAPRRLVLHETLPRTSLGKLRRTAL